MAPNKFENHLKETFDKRTLKPSADAWNRLSERLETAPKKKNNSSYWWLGLAASLIGVLLVTTFFIKKENVELNNPVEIVNTPKSIDKKPENNTNQEATKVAETPAAENKSDSNKKLPIQEQETQKPQQNSEAVIAETKANLNEGLNKEIKTPINELPKALSFEAQKVQDVVAQIQTLTDDNNEVTDAEVEALLLAAQKEINQKWLYNAQGKVDAQLLLASVEAEIDQSFREKVFEALKDGLITVKSAVANRNN